MGDHGALDHDSVCTCCGASENLMVRVQRSALAVSARWECTWRSSRAGDCIVLGSGKVSTLVCRTWYRRIKKKYLRLLGKVDAESNENSEGVLCVS